MCPFSVQFIFARDLCAGRKIGEWRNMVRWVRECEATEEWEEGGGKNET
jgi:glutathione S-transferase